MELFEFFEHNVNMLCFVLLSLFVLGAAKLACEQKLLNYTQYM